jgi:hypothetical protein
MNWTCTERGERRTGHGMFDANHMDREIFENRGMYRRGLEIYIVNILFQACAYKLQTKYRNFVGSTLINI